MLVDASCIGDFGLGGPGMPPLNYTFPDALKGAGNHLFVLCNFPSLCNMVDYFDKTGSGQT